jgi:hypothetical protein
MYRILLCRVGCEPEDVTVDDFPSMQQLVGGDIEDVNIGGGYYAYVNEDGAMGRLPQNACGFLGDFFFTKIDPKECDNVSLTDEDIEKCRRYYKAYRDRKHARRGTGFHTFESTEALQEFHRKVRAETEADFAASQEQA